MDDKHRQKPHQQIKLIIFFFILLCGACSDSKKKPGEKEKPLVVNLIMPGQLTEIDPCYGLSSAQYFINDQIFDGLVYLDSDKNVSPCVARKFSISEDLMKYTFTLRSDVYFHDDSCFTNGKGRRVTAKDFYYSFMRLDSIKDFGAVTFLSFLKRDEKGRLNGIYAPNDTTLILELKKPHSAFIKILTLPYFSVVPKEAVERYKDDFKKHPVGCGPFMIKDWNFKDKIILKKNPNYFLQDEEGNLYPYIDGVKIEFVKDYYISCAELLNDKTDILSGIQNILGADLLDDNGRINVKYEDKFKLVINNIFKTEFIGVLFHDTASATSANPMKNNYIRKAIYHLIDRSKISGVFYKNLALPALGIIPAGFKSHDFPDKETFNPDKAKKLLTQAGYFNQKNHTVIPIHYVVGKYPKQVIEFLSATFNAYGLKVNFIKEDPAVFRDKIKNHELSNFMRSWIAKYPDEENFFTIFYGNNFSPLGFNFFRYKNSEFDRLYEEALSLKDPEKRNLCYKKMQSILMEDLPAIPIVHEQGVHVVSKKLTFIEFTVDDYPNLLTLKKIP
ncbi:MAG: ABC transporter substrate-binding protein [Bacteroidia bacterium]|nr:ABC transporter substrate-binding protein [Bacteroidia bacterium]